MYQRGQWKGPMSLWLRQGRRKRERMKEVLIMMGRGISKIPNGDIVDLRQTNDTEATEEGEEDVHTQIAGDIADVADLWDEERDESNGEEEDVDMEDDKDDEDDDDEMEVYEDQFFEGMDI